MFAINAVWLSVVMLAVDLIAWTQPLLLHGDLAKAQLKTLRYRLLHRPTHPRPTPVSVPVPVQRGELSGRGEGPSSPDELC